MPTPKLNAEIIAAAIEGFESQKRRIDTQIGELRAMLSGGRTEGTVAPEASTRKRKVSAAARRRMEMVPAYTLPSLAMELTGDEVRSSSLRSFPVGEAGAETSSPSMAAQIIWPPSWRASLPN